MTARIDPEIKALRAIERALLPLDHRAQQRIARWLTAKVETRPWVPAEVLEARDAR